MTYQLLKKSKLWNILSEFFFKFQPQICLKKHQVPTHVLMVLLASPAHLSILSRLRNVARPTLFFLRNSTHFWPVSMVSTTMLSRVPHAVEMATSNFSSIAPRSPCNYAFIKVINNFSLHKSCKIRYTFDKCDAVSFFPISLCIKSDTRIHKVLTCWQPWGVCQISSNQ